jgi:NADH-quinone oxidoreductase subunit M
VSAALIALLPGMSGRTIRWVATALSLAEMAFSLPLWWRYQPGDATWQFAEQHTWIPALGASYRLGVDGIAVLLALLTTVLTPIVVISAWSAVEKREREFYALLLALESAMLGTFFSLDLLLFYVFWEAMLVPMYLLIGVWGDRGASTPRSSSSSTPWPAAC